MTTFWLDLLTQLPSTYDDIDLPPRFDWTNHHDGLVILLTVHLESRL